MTDAQFFALIVVITVYGLLNMLLTQKWGIKIVRLLESLGAKESK